MIILNSHFFYLSGIGGYSEFPVGIGLAICNYIILLSIPVCEEERWRKTAVTLHKGGFKKTKKK